MRPRLLCVDGDLPAEGEALAEVIRCAARQAALRAGSRVDIEIPLTAVQRRHLKNLPPGRLEEVRGVVRHQAARFFRPGPAGLAIDVARHPTKPGFIAVALDLAVAHSMLAAAGTVGLRVRDLVPPAAGTAPGLSLLPSEVAHRRRTVAWNRTGWLAVATVAVALILFALTWVRVDQEASLVEATAIRLRPLAGQIQQVRHQLDSVGGMVRAVDDSKRSHQSVLDRLALVSVALPDSAALSSLTIRPDGSVEFGGVALEPLDVLARARRTPGLGAAQLDATQALDPSPGRRWRHFRVRTGGSPE